MLTPMQVQYLVGLCCLKAHPDAVELIVGNMVTDSATDTKRDVDITVTIKDENGATYAFKAYEVKDESTALDVSQVEQLCMKYIDMPLFTHRAIVSASGFSSSAVRKAVYHKVELYTFEDWSPSTSLDGLHEFSVDGTPPISWSFSKALLVWLDGTYFHHEVSEQVPEFVVRNDTPLLSKDGKLHPNYKIAQSFWNELMLRSTEILLHVPPASEQLSTIVGKEAINDSEVWRQVHTLDVLQDGVYILVNEKLVNIQTVTITGNMQWKKSVFIPQFHILKRLSDGEIFAANAIADGSRPGEMYTLTISPGSQQVSVGLFRLTPKQMHALRNLSLL